MSFKFGIIFIGILIFGCAGMGGKDWKLFTSTDLYECFYYVSESPSLYPKRTLKVWIKLEYTEKGVAEFVKAYGKNYETLSYSLQECEIDCKTKKQRVLTFNQYSAEGNILKTKPIKSPLSKTFGNNLAEAVCK